LEKGAANIGPHTIIHRALMDYLFLVADQPAAADMVELLKDHLVAILHTREGARVAQITILLATPKDRKHILKSFKGLIPKISQEQYGHTVLLTLLDAVDDTVLIQKSVIAELVKPPLTATDASEVVGPCDLMRDRYASRVFLFALVGRSLKYQPKYVMDEMVETDVIKARTSKKDASLRMKEVRNLSLPGFLEVASKGQYAAELVRSRFGGQVLVEMMNSSYQQGGELDTADKSGLLDALVEMVGDTAEAYTENVKKEMATQNAKKGLGDQAVKKLAAEMKKEREEAAAASGNPAQAEVLDMETHVLVNRSSTFTLKEILTTSTVSRKNDATTNSKPEKSNATAAVTQKPLEGARKQLAVAIAKALAPNVQYWISHCASDPLHTSGTMLIFTVLLESDDKEVLDALVGGLKKDKAGLKKLMGVLEKGVEKAKKDSVEESKEKEKGGAKRKRDDKGKSKGSDGEQPREKVFGIEVFMNKLKGVLA
jgi:pumilio family protein 6